MGGSGWGLAAGGGLAVAVLVALTPLGAQEPAPRPAAAGSRPLVDAWDLPLVDTLPDDAYGRLVRFGRSVLVATPAHIGPGVADPAMRFAGNNLACADCHLREGRQKFGLPLVGAAVDYPAYSTRRGTEVPLAARIDSCMTRSLNGRPMPDDVPAKQALVAYVTLLSTGLPRDARIVGAAAGAMPELDRAADPARGAGVFGRVCAECHGADGLGVRRNPVEASFGYAVPPLLGPDSFNDGAGSARLITLANFVHDNMPAGTSWVMPILSPEDAWDVAAFVLSQPRPRKAGLDRDFPDLLEKPVDTAYGPYADSFPETLHKYGPFAPIRAEIARLKAERGTVANPNVP